MQHKTLTSIRRMEYGRPCWWGFFRVRLDAPLPPPPTGNVAGNPSFCSLWEGVTERRTDPPPATAGASSYPRSPTSPACLRLASPTTRSYKSTETQRAAHLDAGMNRYPDFYRISRFDIRIKEKFDINITRPDRPCWVSPSRSFKLFSCEIIFELFQPVWETYLSVTDRWADRQLTRYCSISALCVASCGKN